MAAILLLVAISLGLLDNAASGADVPAIFVFGDSTVDAGNNNNLVSPPAAKANFPHYGVDFPGGVATGRFSNGFNGIDYLAQMLGFQLGPPAFQSLSNGAAIPYGANYASGGAGILNTTGLGDISLFTQVTSFKSTAGLPTPPLLAQSLFLISVGSNDIFAFYKNNGPGQSDAAKQQFIGSLVDQLAIHITTLYGLGARKFGIFGTSIIGCVPALRSLNPSVGCIDELNGMSRIFNDGFNARMQALSSQLSGLKYSFGNTLYLMNLVLANPSSYGFKEIQTACCGSGKLNGEAQCGPNTDLCPNRQEYLFWDYFHPTQVAYNLAATKVFVDGSGRFASPIDFKTLAAV